MEYGHFINDANNDTKPSEENVEMGNFYDTFCQYFDNPTMTKIRDDPYFSIYATRINCLLIGLCRYVVVNIPKDNVPIGTDRKMNTMPWTILQTRTMSDKVKCTNSTYKPKTSAIFESQLSITKRTSKSSEYNCVNIPVSVTIFHKKKDEFEYPNNGKLNSAIEIYNTAISRM